MLLFFLSALLRDGVFDDNGDVCRAAEVHNNNNRRLLLRFQVLQAQYYVIRVVGKRLLMEQRFSLWVRYYCCRLEGAGLVWVSALSPENPYEWMFLIRGMLRLCG